MPRSGSRAWTSAATGIAVAVGLVGLVAVLGDTAALTRARIDPYRPPVGACEVGVAEFARSARESLVDCAEPHRAVVLGRERVGPRSPYPGDEVALPASRAICERIWNERGSTDPRFRLDFVWPGAAIWNDGSRRTGFNEVVCLLVAADGSTLPADVPLRSPAVPGR